MPMRDRGRRGAHPRAGRRARGSGRGHSPAHARTTCARRSRSCSARDSSSRPTCRSCCCRCASRCARPPTWRSAARAHLPRRAARRGARRRPQRRRARGRHRLLERGLEQRRHPGAVAGARRAPSGARRAPWVAEALRPTNLAARPGGDAGVPRHRRRAAARPPSRARCPTASSCASSRTAPRRVTGRRPRDPRRAAGRAHRPRRADAALQHRRRGPAADRRVAALAGRLRGGRARRHGRHRGACRVPGPAGSAAARLRRAGGARSRPPAPRGSSSSIRSHRFTDGAEFVARARRPTTPSRRAPTGAGARRPGRRRSIRPALPDRRATRP